MKRQLPRSLGPKAKRQVIREAPDASISCLVEVTPNADPKALAASLDNLKAEVRSWNEPSHFLTIEIPVANLPKLAVLDQVVYVELAERYAP